MIIARTQIGTDPERIRFRHGAYIPKIVADKFGRDFRKDHPLATSTTHDLRLTDGYYAGPIGGTFAVNKSELRLDWATDDFFWGTGMALCFALFKYDTNNW